MSGKKSGVAFFEGSSWFHRVKLLQDDGTTKYSKRGGFTSEEEAEESYYQYEADYKKACRAYQAQHKINKNIGFKDYLLYWFEEVYSQRIQNTTRMVGAYTLYDLILPHLEQDIKLKYLNAEYLDALLETVAKTTESAGNKSRELISVALKEAVADGYIKTNPIDTTKTYPRRKPNVTILSKAKLKEFLGVAADNNWYMEILLGLFCGLRKGEILGLKFSDVDFEDRTITISRQITSSPVVEKGDSKIEAYNIEEKEPKTENSYRKLKVPKPVIAEIMKRKEMIDLLKSESDGNYIDGDYISCQANGVPHAASAMNNALTKLCKRNAMPHITVHGLRHMYATILLEQGVQLVTVSALLGHSSVNTTFEYYCEIMDETEKIIGFMNNTFVPEGENDSD